MSIERFEVDLGASGNRVCQKRGIIDTIPNNMVFIDMDKFVDLVPYDENIMNCLEVKITKDNVTEAGENEFFPCHALVGVLADRYSATNVRPSVAENKLTQRVNYISSILSAAFLKLKNGGEDDIILYMALPPVEVKKGKEIVGEKLCGHYDVEFPKFQGGTKVSFNIKEVRCFEESRLALMAFLFTKEGRLKEENKDCMKGYTLSVDIGASTADFAIMKDGQYLEKTGKTYKVGGNVAREYLNDSIREEFGYDLPIEEAELAMMEGRIRVGATYKVITEYVEEAKKNLANSLTEQIMTYFRQVNIPIQMISNIVVSGGGSLESFYLDENDMEVITSQPTSKFLTDSIHKICEEVNVVYYGKSARLANITGLFIQASIEELLEQRKQQEMAQ